MNSVPEEVVQKSYLIGLLEKVVKLSGHGEYNVELLWAVFNLSFLPMIY